MRAARNQMTGRLRRGMPGALALALVTAGALAGANPAAAAQHSAAVPRGAAVSRDAGRPAGHVTAAGTISTVAGGLGGPAKGTTMALGDLCGVAYGAGSVYLGSVTVVRKLDPATGQVATEAGDGLNVGSPGDGGPAADATLGSACQTAVDHHGNLVILDTDAGTIRVVAATTGTFYQQHMTAGDIYTVGNSFGISLDGGFAVDPAGNLLVSVGDSRQVEPYTIQVMAERNGTFYGQEMTAGSVSIVAGDGREGFSGDGGPATKAKLNFPGGVTADNAGNLVFTDSLGKRIRVVANKTGMFYGRKMTAGDIYTVAGDGKPGDSGDGGPAAKAEVSAGDLTVDGTGNLLLAAGEKIRVVAAKSGTFYGKKMTRGDIYTVAGNGTAGFSGDGGPATAAEFDGPDPRVDGSGNLVISDGGNKRVRVVAVKAGTFYGKKMTAADVYTVAGNGTLDSSGNGGPAVKAEFNDGNVAVDNAGNMLIPDVNGNQIRVVAVKAGTFYGRAMATGDIYGVAGNGTAGFSGDGGPATKAELNSPSDVVADAAGNLVIADPENERIRVVATRTGTFYRKKMTAGDIYTVAGNGHFGFSGDGGPATKAKLHQPVGVAVDSSGNVLIADSFNSRVRMVAVKSGTFYGQAVKAGDIYTVAGGGDSGLGDGGPATAAETSPNGVAVDGAGNMLIADGDSRIRVVAATSGTFYGQAMIAGDIYTVAGNGEVGFSGDGGPATEAGMDAPKGVAVDGAGNLLIADTVNHRVRVVAVTSGTFYGRAMTAGDIYTVAGDSPFCGVSGDGGPGTAAGLCFPQGVSADGAGNLLIADSGNGRIREVSG